jgi:hypothetical protein
METIHQIAERLESHYSDRYRRVWIQLNSRASSRDVLVTLFPNLVSEEYQMVSLRSLPEISFESIVVRLERELSLVKLVND